MKIKKSKTLIISKSNHALSKLIPIAKKLKQDRTNEVMLVGVNNDAPNKLKENIKFKNIKDYGIHKKFTDINKKAISWIKQWPNRRIQKNKNFKEITAYKKVSLWWLVEFWFFYAYSFNFHPIREIIKNIEIIQSIISTEKPDHIIVFNSRCLVGKITFLIGDRKKIPVSSVEPGIVFDIKYFIIKHSIPYLIKTFKNVKSLLREFSGKFSIYFSKRKTKPFKYKILMVTHPTYRQLTIDPQTNERVKEDIILDPVIRELQKNKKNEIVVVDTDPFPTFRFLFDKNYKHIEGYLTRKIKKRISFEARAFSRKWKRLKQKKSFINSLTYKNIPIFELLENKFSEIFNRKFFESIKYIEMMKQVIKKEKPSILVIVDEYGLYGRSAIIAGKINKIPILAIQHGIISPYHIGCCHTKDEILKTDIIAPKYCPIPNKTAVSGNYYRNILLKSGSYPLNSVVTTGQPKYDVLAFANKIYKKEKIYSQLNIKPNKKLIVFASQSDVLGTNELLFRSVFKAVKKIPNTQLVIKLHPLEYDTSLHHNIAKEVGIDVIIIKNINLLELLFACDLMMTFNSTVAIEAMILDKPVITVNLTSYPDEMPFAESGAAIGVYKKEDIKLTITKVFRDKKLRKKLEIKRKDFVFKHVYKIDGLTSKRIANLINDMLKNSIND